MVAPIVIWGLATAAVFAINYLLREDIDDEEIRDKTGRGSSVVAKEGEILPVVFGRCRVNTPNIVLYPENVSFRDYYRSSRYRNSSDDPYEFIVDVQMAVCAVPATDVITNCKGVWVGNKKAWSGNITLSPTTAVIDEPNFFGGKGKGGGIGRGNHLAVGEFRMYLGAHTQTEDTYAQIWAAAGPGGIGASPGGMPGVMHFLLNNFSFGENSSMPAVAVEVSVCPNISGIEDESGNGSGMDANPAAVLYQILTDKWTGIGLPEASINKASFATAATTLLAEENGFSMVLRKSMTPKKLIGIVLKQIDGVLYLDATTQEITLKLLREDYGAYPYAALDVFGDSDVVKIASYKLTSWDETYNQVRVEFEDRAAEYETRFAVSQDAGGANFRGQIRSTTLVYPGVKTGTLAAAICARDLKFFATPQLFVSLEVNRSAGELAPGDVFKWSCSEYGITEMVLRINDVNHGSLDDGTIVLHCTQDKFSQVATTFAVPGAVPWQIAPKIKWGGSAIDGAVVLSEPAGLDGLIQRGGQRKPPTDGSAWMLFGSYDADVIAAAVEASLDGGVTYFSVAEEISTVPFGKVSTDYAATEGPYYDTTTGIVIHGVSDITALGTYTEAEIRAGKGLVVVGDEMLAYESFTDLGSGSYRLNNIWRGLHDTTAKSLKTNQDVFFVGDADLRTQKVPARFALEQNVLFRISAATASDKQPVADALIIDHTTTRRAQRATLVEGFTLYVEGYDAVGDHSEVGYAYDPLDNKAVESTPYTGSADISSTTDMGRVFTNDLRAAWKRRPRKPKSIIRGDDPDQAPPPGEGTFYKFEAKRDKDTDWAVIHDTPYGNNTVGKISAAWEFPSLARLLPGPGQVRLCSYRNADDNGEEVCSQENEAIAVDMVSCRQLLINRKLRPYWDLLKTNNQDPSAYAGGQPVIGLADRSARGWQPSKDYNEKSPTGTTSDPGPISFANNVLSIENGASQTGHASLAEQRAVGNSIIQKVSVPYLDTEGSTVQARWKYLDYPSANDTYTVYLKSFDAQGAQVDAAAVGPINKGTADDWFTDELSLTLSAGVVSLSLELEESGDGGQFGNVEMHMSPDISAQLLANNEFVSGTTSWTTAAGTWTTTATPRLTVGTTGSQHLEPTGAGVDNIIGQGVALPASASAGDWIRLSFWAQNLGVTDEFRIVLEARDIGASVITDTTYGDYSHGDNIGSWRNHEVWLEVPPLCAIINVTIYDLWLAGSLPTVIFAEFDLRVLKSSSISTTLDYSAGVVQPQPLTPTAFETACDTPGVIPDYIFPMQDGVGVAPVDIIRGVTFDTTIGTDGVDLVLGAPAIGLSNGTDPVSKLALELSKTGGGLSCSDTNFLNPDNKSFGIYLQFRITGVDHSGGANIIRKANALPTPTDGSGFNVWYDASSQRLYLDVTTNHAEGSPVTASCYTAGLPEDGAWHWAYFKFDVTAELLSAFSDFSAGTTAALTTFLAQEMSNTEDAVHIGRNDVIGGLYDDGFDSPFQIGYMAIFRGTAAELFTRTAGQNMWLHGTDPNLEALTATRAGTILFPLSASRVGTFAGSTGGGPVQIPQMWKSGFSDTTKLGLPSFPATKNWVPYAEDISHANWTKANATVTAKAVQSPRGVLEAQTVAQTGAAGTLGNAHITVTGLTAVTNYTLSLYVASVGGTNDVDVKVTKQDLTTTLASATLVAGTTFQRLSLSFTTELFQDSTELCIYGGPAADTDKTAAFFGIMIQEEDELGPVVLNYDATLNSSNATVQSLTTTANELVNADEGALHATYLTASTTATLAYGARTVCNVKGTATAEDERRLEVATAGSGESSAYDGVAALAANSSGHAVITGGVEVVRTMKWRARANLAAGAFVLEDTQNAVAVTDTGVWTPGDGNINIYVGCRSDGAQQLAGVVQEIKLYQGEPRSTDY